MKIKRNIVLYDSDCNFCNNWIAFLKNRLANKEMLFTPNKSSEAERLFGHFKITNKDSVVYINDDIFYIKSSAVLKICSQLKYPYNIIQYIAILPTPILDFIYELVAKKRNFINNKKKCCNE